MMPIAAASFHVKPNNKLPKNVKNTPIWAAAPKSISLGWESIAEKSVIAPTPKNISGG